MCVVQNVTQLFLPRHLQRLLCTIIQTLCYFRSTFDGGNRSLGGGTYTSELYGARRIFYEAVATVRQAWPISQLLMNIRVQSGFQLIRTGSSDHNFYLVWGGVYSYDFHQFFVALIGC